MEPPYTSSDCCFLGPFDCLFFFVSIGVQALQFGSVYGPCGAIKKPKPSKSLRRDQEKVILTTDKGVAMVVMEKNEYIRKSEDLLNQTTYTALTTDPTNKCKNKLINLLKTIKAEGGIDNNIYKRLYPAEAVPPKCYGPAQNTQEGHTTQAHDIQQGLSHI